MDKLSGLIRREYLATFFGSNSRLVRGFEQQAQAVDDATDGLATTAAATTAMDQATVIVLSPNQAFANERVLVLGDGLTGSDDGARLTVKTSSNIPKINGGFKLFLTVSGDASLEAPLSGRLATLTNTETLTNKTLDAPKVTGLGNYANDGAAAAGGVPVGGIYRNGSVLQVRVT